MNFNDKRESSGDFLIKMIIFLGAVSAIFVAVALLLKKYRNKIGAGALNDIDFEDDDFCCDCCDYEDCTDCESFDDSAYKADIVAEDENTEPTEA